MKLNAGTPIGTALLRSGYLAAGSFLVAFLPAWAVTDDIKGPAIAGGMSALWALGFRGALEGLSDRARDQSGKVVAGDVGARVR